MKQWCIGLLALGSMTIPNAAVASIARREGLVARMSDFVAGRTLTQKALGHLYASWNEGFMRDWIALFPPGGVQTGEVDGFFVLFDELWEAWRLNPGDPPPLPDKAWDGLSARVEPSETPPPSAKRGHGTWPAYFENLRRELAAEFAVSRYEVERAILCVLHPETVVKALTGHDWAHVLPGAYIGDAFVRALFEKLGSYNPHMALFVLARFSGAEYRESLLEKAGMTEFLNNYFRFPKPFPEFENPRRMRFDFKRNALVTPFTRKIVLNPRFNEAFRQEQYAPALMVLERATNRMESLPNSRLKGMLRSIAVDLHDQIAAEAEEFPARAARFREFAKSRCRSDLEVDED